MPTAVVDVVTLGEKTKSFVDMFQNGLTIVRDMFLLGLFIAFLFFPTSLNNTLSKAGIAQINGGMFEWKPQVQQAQSQNVSAAQETSGVAATLQDVKSALDQIAASSKDAASRKAATDVSNDVAGTLTRLDEANKTLAASYIAQQDLLRSASSSTTTSSAPAATAAAAGPLVGWVYLGKVGPLMKKWVTPPQPKVDNSSPEVKSGQTITFNDDLFVRGDKPTGGRFNQASTLGAVRAGTSATVLEVQPSPARNGGDFLWVKISAAQGK